MWARAGVWEQGYSIPPCIKPNDTLHPSSILHLRFSNSGTCNTPVTISHLAPQNKITADTSSLHLLWAACYQVVRVQAWKEISDIKCQVGKWAILQQMLPNSETESWESEQFPTAKQWVKERVRKSLQSREYVCLEIAMGDTLLWCRRPVLQRLKSVFHFAHLNLNFCLLLWLRPESQRCSHTTFHWFHSQPDMYVV